MKFSLFSTALGSGSFCGMNPVQAAEWSLVPLYSVSVDYDSNRRLSLPAHGSEATVLTADLRFKRALEDNDFYIEPRYSFRRFSDRTLGNGDDRSLFAGFDLYRERSVLNVTGSFWDQSTLITEALETGILVGNTHRRQIQAAGSYTWTHSERRQLVSQLSFYDVKYFGPGRELLPGYRYPLGSIGERYAFSEKGSVTISAYGSSLASQSRGNSSHELGLQAQLQYAFSERSSTDVSIGESKRVLAGTSGHGTDAAVSFKHDYTLGSISLGYTRSLVPYGIGYLVQRSQVSFTAIRNLSPHTDASASIYDVRNNELAALLGVDRPRYDGGSLSLNWHPRETWTVSSQVAALRTRQPGAGDVAVSEWRGAVTVIWNPYPTVRSW